MEDERKVCSKCNHWAAVSSDPTGLCVWCRKAEDQEKVADAKQIEVHGVKVRPTFVSGSGTNNRCNSIQGWVIASAGFCDQYERWFQAKKDAVARVERDWKDWTENGGIEWQEEKRERVRRFWGDTSMSLFADVKIAEQRAAAEAQRMAHVARMGAEKLLHDAAPDMLAALKWAEKVISLSLASAVGNGRDESLVAIRAAISKAEKGV